MAQDDEEAEALGIPWETVQAEFGFDDELLADYPEQARRFIEDEERALRRRDRRPPFDLARFQPRRQPIVISEFDAWVGTNNIADHFEFGKGWWDYVELIRTFAARLDSEDVRVVGHHIVETPPPTELLPMPAVAIVTPAATFAFRYDFGTWCVVRAAAAGEHLLVTALDLVVPSGLDLLGGPRFLLLVDAREQLAGQLDALIGRESLGLFEYRMDVAAHGSQLIAVSAVARRPVSLGPAFGGLGSETAADPSHDRSAGCARSWVETIGSPRARLSIDLGVFRHGVPRAALRAILWTSQSGSDGVTSPRLMRSRAPPRTCRSAP